MSIYWLTNVHRPSIITVYFRNWWEGAKHQKRCRSNLVRNSTLKHPIIRIWRTLKVNSSWLLRLIALLEILRKEARWTLETHIWSSPTLNYIRNFWSMAAQLRPILTLVQEIAHLNWEDWTVEEITEIWVREQLSQLKACRGVIVYRTLNQVRLLKNRYLAQPNSHPRINSLRRCTNLI